MTTIPVNGDAVGKVIPWHTLSIEEVLNKLNSTKLGITTKEATSRIRQFGYNELSEERPPRWIVIFLRQFRGTIIWVLIAASIISAILGEWIDSGAVLSILFLNAFLGSLQEHAAEKGIAALRALATPTARVLRDGVVAQIPVREIVPGDIVELEAGDLIPADLRLVEVASVQVVESALTGESEAVSKQLDANSSKGAALADRQCMLFMGTLVATGIARGVVTATGMNTEVGAIARLLNAQHVQLSTPLQEKMERFGYILIRVALGIVALLFLIGIFRGLPIKELFLTVVSLAIAAVPEGLPAVVTIALGLGVRRMARRGALIRKLYAVETLGSTDVICTDKTGTLTLGHMTARRLFVDGATLELSGEGYNPTGELKQLGAVAPRVESMRLYAEALLGCSSASVVKNEEGQWSAIGDPTEAALVVAAAKAGVDRREFEAANSRVSEFPFDGDRKRRTVIRKSPSGLRAYTNGAPETLLPYCNMYLRDGIPVAMPEEVRHGLEEKNRELASLGFRIIGSASRNIEGDSLPATNDEAECQLTFIGFSALHDPPRLEAQEAIKRCKDAGIRVVMITGDQPRTALSIANTLGITSQASDVLSGPELEQMDDDALFKKVESVAIYARVTATHKLRIVKAWQAHGATVAMTGDGVNDAPALHGADIGIAMGRSGTEVAKQVSAMIITDDNFSTIVVAVEQGRGVFTNIRKTVQYLLAGNFGELLFMMTCIAGGLAIPLRPIHLLWINLVTDGLPALCLAADPISRSVMSRKPSARNKLVDREFILGVLIAGGMTALVTLLVYVWALNANPAFAQTYAFTTLVFCELARSFGARSEREPIWSFSPLSNLRLLIVVVATFAIQIWSHHSAVLATVFQTKMLNLNECLILIAIGLVPLAVLELTKLIRR